MSSTSANMPESAAMEREPTTPPEFEERKQEIASPDDAEGRRDVATTNPRTSLQTGLLMAALCVCAHNHQTCRTFSRR
jgi:hypothetical protein